MSDRLKLTLFNMLVARDQPRGRVLDLYSGTGALAIEALSRGAEWADLVEQNGSMCGVIRENLRHTRLEGRARVHKQSVGSYLAHPPETPYDLVMLDPPYADPAIQEVLELVGSRGFVEPDGLVVLGHTSRRELDVVVGPLELETKRCHGDSCISFYRVAEEPPGSENQDKGHP